MSRQESGGSLLALLEAVAVLGGVFVRPGPRAVQPGAGLRIDLLQFGHVGVNKKSVSIRTTQLLLLKT